MRHSWHFPDDKIIIRNLDDGQWIVVGFFSRSGWTRHAPLCHQRDGRIGRQHLGDHQARS